VCLCVCECLSKEVGGDGGSSIWLENIWFNFGRSSKQINMNGLGIVQEKPRGIKVRVRRRKKRRKDCTVRARVCVCACT